MEDNRQFDARDRRDSFYYWAHEETLKVILPLVGYLATHLYHVLVWLVPKVERLGEEELSLRTLEKWSLLSKSSVQRQMQLLTAIGIVECIPGDPGRPPMYVLVNLKPITDLGKAELVKRLRTVPWWDTTPEGKAVKEAEETARGKAESVSVRADAAPEDVEANQASTEGCIDGGVPRGDTEAKDGQKVNQTGNLSQKQGGTVPENAGERPRKGGGLSQGGTLSGSPLNVLTQEHTHELKTPPTPRGEEKVFTRELVLPYADPRHGEAGFIACLDVATRWVLECQGVTNPRPRPVVFGAMKLKCEAAGMTVSQVAKLALRSRLDYMQAWEAGEILGEHAYGVLKFYRDAHWLNPNAWPWNQAKRAEAAERLLAGARAAEREQKRIEDMKVALSFWLTLKDRGSVRYPRECPADLRELLENKLEWVRAFCGETP